MTAPLAPSAPLPPPTARGHVQVHLTEGRVSPTSIPVLPPVAPPVRVAVLGRGVALDPSARWTRTCPDDPDLDVLIVETDDAADVRRLVADHLGVAVVVVLSATAPSTTLVKALSAGADACLRGASSAELAAHLSAIARRRMARSPRPCSPSSSRTGSALTPKDPR